MRRKSERTATKKPKPSPEKKVEKVKRTRTRRRKQSTSSENDSPDEAVIVPKEVEIVKEPPKTPVKEDSPEELHDQVWQVKAAEGSGDVGEIQKLKICLTRPPSTPERVDRSPRSKRKHSRATSSSDTPSVEGAEDRKKSKHRSKKAIRESKDDTDKNQDSQEDPDGEAEPLNSGNEISQSTNSTEENICDETPMSTTNDEVKSSGFTNVIETVSEKLQEDIIDNSRSSDADTTVASPKPESTDVSLSEEKPVSKENEQDNEINEINKRESIRESIEDKSEILELHPEPENKGESLEAGIEISNKNTTHTVDTGMDTVEEKSSNVEVSKTGDKKENNSKEIQSSVNVDIKSTDINHVVASTEQTDKGVDETYNKSNTDSYKSNDTQDKCSESNRSAEDSVTNIVISRKRRWGSRPSKISTQKSITISTDVLKDIIPDVKPVEFEEVIEEKKNKREVTEKVERPILPKIIIDNSENAELYKKKEQKEKDSVNPLNKDTQISSNRKISIVKENDSIITRPPSPPRHKPSPILYITNLVRPFTLLQLKNLLQRTGKIVEDGFWIDKIKSKCFVKYETEDQAIETRHALHGVTWPVSNPKTLQVDFSNEEALEKAKSNEDSDNAQVSTIPGTVEDWLREQDLKREKGELEKPYERKTSVREWDMGKNEKDKEKDKLRRPDERPPLDKRRHRSVERSPEPARKFKKKEEEAPAKLLDDLFRKTKTAPCIYWLPLSAETIAIKEEQRRQHMAEHERRLLELRRTHRRH